ncbi:glycosyl hydrolase [Dinghuibacter silviterrae]|uniref:Concanavalin A-like lectin/glucanase superfamily protein n=1 Tax=Dinghuibacter silviterrae TaxID=1539049 RepID=A0A4R8DI36_9BACT|nr:glycosyl hydrolase [Dinghuibacter silviterrae]TDW96954.1 concanavalin A-like lectin/glucanase superfamily protein [Dinghuibacter silviterrae]
MASAGVWLLPASAGEDGLLQGFRNPPSSARPLTYWTWMNGHITREGITMDLEAMRRMGIGGAIGFDVALGIPRGPVDYASETWMELVRHAVMEADRLGLEFFLQNAPGYSGSGGPWITPEMSMQQLVWTEARAQGGQIDLDIPQPYARQGYYRDAFVLAYPALPVEGVLMKDRVAAITLNGQEIDAQLLLDGNPETKLRLDRNSQLCFRLDGPFEARAITIYRQPETPLDAFDGPRDYPPVFDLECSDDGTRFAPVCRIHMPALRAMNTPGAQSFAPVRASWYRLIPQSPTWISGMELHSGPRLAGWPGKTNYTGGNAGGETPSFPRELVIAPGSVLDITASMDISGRLRWTAPEARAWTILRIGHTTTGEMPAAHPDSAPGLELDKLRKEALDQHFTHFLTPLIQRLKPFAGKAFRGIMSDSWEAGKQNWTREFPGVFKQSRGYDIIPWMPAMTGRIVGSIQDTERFLWDMRRVQADMLAENFYGHLHQKCRAGGLQLYAEPYGDGTFDSLQVATHLDVTMSEFWSRYIYGSDDTSKQAASAAHALGQKVAAAEAFTGMPATSKWTDYPYSLKAEGDYFFTLGVNRLVFHTFVHQPYTTGRPGMTMGPFGSHFDRHNTWTEQAHAWTRYLARAQYLLQQGHFVADACCFKGDEPQSGVPDTYAFMPAGYVCDVVGPDALRRFSIERGRILLPGGMTYRLCVLAEGAVITPATQALLDALVGQGMVLVPQHSVRDALNFPPDFSYTADRKDAVLHYVHRRVGDTDVYMVANHRRRPERVNVSFRVTGRRPEIWNAESGVVHVPPCYDVRDGRTYIPLDMEPAGALFVIFGKTPATPARTTIHKDGRVLLDTRPFPTGIPGPYPDVVNDFSITLWAKPDTFAHPGKSFLFHSCEGTSIYGPGHASVGMSAGQNIVRVYERATGAPREVLSANGPLQGWTHLALVYQAGKPTLYLDGRLSAQGEGSGLLVHPGLDTLPAEDQFSSFFEGNNTPPILMHEALSPQAVADLFHQGLPAPEKPPALTLGLVWENGHYDFGEITGCYQVDVDGPWSLHLQESAVFTLSALTSLRLHPDFDVAHFSGTASYRKTVQLPGPGRDRRVFIDLGRVEVIAEVYVNGRSTGIAWKEPYRVDITAALRPGANDLDIRVTTLWPNRLIGDEYLSVENEYTKDHSIERLPAWFVGNQPKPGDRKTFAVWKDFDKDAPLLEAGLLGPVRVYGAVEKTFV